MIQICIDNLVRGVEMNTRMFWFMDLVPGLRYMKQSRSVPIIPGIGRESWFILQCDVVVKQNKGWKRNEMTVGMEGYKTSYLQ